jgi:hypothetical protein
MHMLTHLHTHASMPRLSMGPPARRPAWGLLLGQTWTQLPDRRSDRCCWWGTMAGGVWARGRGQGAPVGAISLAALAEGIQASQGQPLEPPSTGPQPEPWELGPETQPHAQAPSTASETEPGNGAAAPTAGSEPCSPHSAQKPVSEGPYQVSVEGWGRVAHVNSRWMRVAGAGESAGGGRSGLRAIQG